MVIKCFLHLGVAHVSGSVSPIIGWQNTEFNAKESKPCFLLSSSMYQLLNYTAFGVCLASKLDMTSTVRGLVNRMSQILQNSNFVEGRGFHLYSQSHFFLNQMTAAWLPERGNCRVACLGLSTWLSQGCTDEKKCCIVAQPY